MDCIEIYEALLAESSSPAGVDACIPSSFLSGCMTEGCRSRTRRYHVLIHHAYALQERYSHTGQDSDLDAAIVQGRAALATCETESALCPTVLVIHAGLLQKSFGRTGDCNELRMAESFCRQGLALCTTACTLSATAYHTLSWIMFRLYSEVGTSVYLDEALDLQRKGLDLKTAPHNAEDHQYLRALAVYTLDRYDILGHPQDVDHAMSFLEQALELCPVMHINRIAIVQSMIIVVHVKYQISGRLEDLNKGIDLGRQIAAAPNFPRGQRRLGFLSSLANLLSDRYEIGLSTDCDLEESIKLRREGLQCIAPGSALGCIRKSKFVLCVWYKAHQTIRP
jgi:hypothetical protein